MKTKADTQASRFQRRSARAVEIAGSERLHLGAHDLEEAGELDLRHERVELGELVEVGDVAALGIEGALQAA